MRIKQFNNISDSDIWDLSKTDDIIFTKEGSEEQRVLINFETYKAIKKALANRSKISDNLTAAESFDLNPFLQDLIDIVNTDQFEDITDNDHYFENFVRKLNQGE
ncbi:MAG: hypothetical protein ACOY90_11875 [Candidatus Zhuqueibacterota bacterium]